MKFFSLLVLALILSGGFAQTAAGENWPAWRGPRGDGSSLERCAPTKWSATQNVLWKTEIPGVGHSSPIVWGDRVFTATAIPEKKERALVCLERKTGAILWQKTVLSAPLEAKQVENSYASCTPATDGEKIYVAFQDVDRIAVAAHDFSGKQLWLVHPGEFQNDHGFSSSPVLFDGKVYLSAEGKKGNFMVCLSREDGHTIWKNNLENPSNSFGQPLIRTLAGRPQLILPGDKAVTSYDPATGKRLWFTDNIATDFVITPVFNDKAGLLLVTASWPKKELQAVRPDGTGDVTKSKIVWKNEPAAPYCPSPISVGNYFMTISNGGEMYCLDAAGGKVFWHEKIGHAHASPVAVGGLVYFQNDAGVTSVVKAAEKFELVSRNELGEKTFASPAISDGQIFLKGDKHLFCIGQ